MYRSVVVTLLESRGERLGKLFIEVKSISRLENHHKSYSLSSSASGA